MTEQNQTSLAPNTGPSAIDVSTDFIIWVFAAIAIGTLIGLVCASGLMKCYGDDDKTCAVKWVFLPLGGASGIFALDKFEPLTIFPDNIVPIFLIAFSIWVIIPAAIEAKDNVIQRLRPSRPKRTALDTNQFRRVASRG